MVVPSRYEGLGLVAIEAMILGTVVVNSGAGGLRSIFKDYPKYICNNVNEYVECIEKLFSGDKNTYRDDCVKMNKNFTNMKKYKNKLLEIYGEVLNDK